MYSQPTEYTCPQCYSTDMILDPTNDRVGCEGCKLVFTEESLTEWEQLGIEPEPLGRVGEV